MPSSLVPEKPLLIYPSLAATLGLEESLLLCSLSEEVPYLQAEHTRGFDWYLLDIDPLLDKLPFWNTHDLHRICISLREKGVIIIGTNTIEDGGQLRFAFNEKAQQQIASNARSNTQSTAAPQAQPPRAQETHRPPGSSVHSSFLNKNFIAPNWQPNETTLGQLAQHSISREFAMQFVPEFITYWRERGEQHHSWGSKFMKHVLVKWRNYETERYRKDQDVPIQHDWKPSPDAVEILVEKAGIRREFVEDAMPEFILYWRERGDSHRTWNTKFVQHVRIQWAKFTAAIEHNTDPHPIPATWQPSNDVYDVLRLANIDIPFAQALTPEFVIYWQDRGILYGSWNTKYLQHVKRMWAQRHEQQNAEAQGNRQTRDIQLEEELTDRSWAN